jgi:hypothetical protein
MPRSDLNSTDIQDVATFLYWDPSTGHNDWHHDNYDYDDYDDYDDYENEDYFYDPYYYDINS